jgi:hypothetical protein
MAVVDYVDRCDPSTPTEVQVNAVEGDTVSVNGSPPQTGQFTVQVDQQVGESFPIEVTSNGTTTTHFVRCLPTDFPSWSAERAGSPQAAFYATLLIQQGMPSHYAAIFDTNGAPVWWLEDRQPGAPLNPLPNRNFAVVGGNGLKEYDLNGTLVRTLTTVGAVVDFHDVILLPNGNYVLVTFQQQSCNLTSWGLGSGETCVNHVFQELTPSGGLVGAWDTASHIPVTETPPRWRGNHETVPSNVFDPWHYNSVEFTGDGFILSFRHLDAIYKINSLTSAGSIVWKLSGTPRPESLTLVDDPLNGVIGQHDARWLGDGTVSIYDNGSNAFGGGSHRQPRSVRYRVDTVAKTATLLEDVRDSDVPSSFCCGSARRLPGGNWVTGWGSTDTITENGPDDTRVFRLRTPFVYRGIPLLPGQFTADEFRAGMDAQFAS